MQYTKGTKDEPSWSSQFALVLYLYLIILSTMKNNLFVKVEALEEWLAERGIKLNRSKLIALYNQWKNDPKQDGDFYDFVEEEIN